MGWRLWNSALMLQGMRIGSRWKNLQSMLGMRLLTWQSACGWVPGYAG
jgi:hypothetical protein